MMISGSPAPRTERNVLLLQPLPPRKTPPVSASYDSIPVENGTHTDGKVKAAHASCANTNDFMRIRTFGGLALHADCYVPVPIIPSRADGLDSRCSNRTSSPQQHYQRYDAESRDTLDDMRYGASYTAAACVSPSDDRRDDDTRTPSPLPVFSPNRRRNFGHRAQKYCSRLCSKQTLRDHLPIVRWLPRYNLNKLKCDAIAGITVGLTAIPQCLAYAAIATLPLQYGLYSAFMGCFVYTFLGTSKDITLGPTAITSLMTAEYLQHIKNDELRAKYAVLLGFVTGVVQFLMGVLQLGFLVRFISHPVIVGFVSSAAVSIAATQVDDVLGFSVKSRDFFPSLYEILANLNKIRWADLLLGSVCVAGLVGMSALGTYAAARVPPVNDAETGNNKLLRYRKLVLKYISILRNAIIVVLACAAAAVLEATRGPGTFRLTRRVTPGIPVPSLPDFTLDSDGFVATLRHLGSGIILMPIVAILESLAIGKAFANRNGYNIDSTQEIVAIGACNTLSALFRGYPVTGSFSRTALNSACGVKTPAGGLWTGALVLLALSVLSPLFRFVPEAALGAVIICAVLPMFEWHEILLLWRVRKLDLVPCLLTFFGCLLFGIEIGIGLGVVMSLCMLAYAAARPEIQVVEWLSHNTVLIKPHAALYYPSGEYLHNVVEKTMQSIERRRRHQAGLEVTGSFNDVGESNRQLEVIRIVLDASCIADFDASTMRAMKTVVDMVTKQPHFDLYFANLNAEMQKLLTVAGCKPLRLYNCVIADGSAVLVAPIEAMPPPPTLSSSSPATKKHMAQLSGSELAGSVTDL